MSQECRDLRGWHLGVQQLTFGAERIEARAAPQGPESQRPRLMAVGEARGHSPMRDVNER
jgi:hypothetical protein